MEASSSSHAWPGILYFNKPAIAFLYSLSLVGSTAMLRVSACQFIARAFRDCSCSDLAVVLLWPKAGKPPDQAAVTFRQTETKGVQCELNVHFPSFVVHVFMLRFDASCSHAIAYVLVAWCRTYHERSLCLLRRVLVKSCPVARFTASSGTPQQQHSFYSLLFLFPPAHSWVRAFHGFFHLARSDRSTFSCLPVRLCFSMLSSLRLCCSLCFTYDTGFS